MSANGMTHSLKCSQGNERQVAWRGLIGVGQRSSRATRLRCGHRGNKARTDPTQAIGRSVVGCSFCFMAKKAIRQDDPQHAASAPSLPTACGSCSVSSMQRTRRLSMRQTRPAINHQTRRSLNSVNSVDERGDGLEGGATHEQAIHEACPPRRRFTPRPFRAVCFATPTPNAAGHHLSVYPQTDTSWERPVRGNPRPARIHSSEPPIHLANRRGLCVAARSASGVRAKHTGRTAPIGAVFHFLPMESIR